MKKGLIYLSSPLWGIALLLGFCILVTFKAIDEYFAKELGQ